MEVPYSYIYSEHVHRPGTSIGWPPPSVLISYMVLLLRRVALLSRGDYISAYGDVPRNAHLRSTLCIEMGACNRSPKADMALDMGLLLSGPVQARTQAQI